MITLHGEEVKIGDRVWSILRGWGEVRNLVHEEWTNYPICVKFEADYNWFTQDGKFRTGDTTPVLFWQPIEFEIPKKPKQKEKAWQWVCKTGDKYWLTYSYYASGEELLKRIPDTEPIEPYLPSEIEREKVE